MSPFAETLRALRKNRNLLQKDAAIILGYEQSYLSGLETGSKGLPKQEFLNRVKQKYELNEHEQSEMESAIKESRRTLMIPYNAPVDVYRMLNKLQNQIERLHPRQMTLINIALELGESSIDDALAPRD